MIVFSVFFFLVALFADTVVATDSAGDPGVEGGEVILLCSSSSSPLIIGGKFVQGSDSLIMYGERKLNSLA